jgi:hypothetical protein
MGLKAILLGRALVEARPQDHASLPTTLLARHQRFEHCPALSAENSREGFRSLIDRIKTYVSLIQVQVLRRT